MSQWRAYIHKDSGRVSDTGITIVADSADAAAVSAVRSYWFDLPDRRVELFDLVDEVQRAITIVVYEPPQKGSGSHTPPEPWLGTVTIGSSDIETDDVSIHVEKTQLRA